MSHSPANFTFDFVNLIISGNGIGVFSVESELYSDWKSTVAADTTGLAAKVPPAFLESNIGGVRAGGSVGGNPTGPGETISPYFFLNNIDGWRIRPAEMNGETTLEGNLFALDVTRPSFIPTLGGYTATVRLKISPQSLTTVVETISSGLTPAESTALLFIQKLLRNEMITTKQGETVTLGTSPETVIPSGKITLLDDDNLTVILQADLYEDAQGLIQYRGKGVERRKRME